MRTTKPAALARSVSLCLALCSALLFGTQAHAQVLIEDFDDDSIDPALWTAHVYGSGPQLAEVNGQLEIVIPATSSGADFGVKLSSNFLLRGDFEVQVDFRLIEWPYSNGVRLGLGTDQDGLLPHPGVERISFGQSDYPWAPREAYLTDFPDGVHGITATDDAVGTLRLVRKGNWQTGYYHDPDGWVSIHTGPAPTTDVGIKIAAWSGYQFTQRDVTAAFDDLVVNRGVLVWPDPAWSACCFLGGWCLLGSEEACWGAEGRYMGDGAACEPDPCP
jgi:hypothetical protein